jgi:hypothetical protein
MNISRIFAATRLAFLTLVAALFLNACGSSGSSDSDSVDITPVATTGMVGILFTDAPTDDYSAINLNVVKAILIGEDEKQEIVFEGSEPVNLLDLENFSEPLAFGEVQAGTYTKLRLIVDELELVPVIGEPIRPHLPGNGKIDMLDADGFTVLAGRTLLMEIDMDANKSIKITDAGNSGKVNFRPVVKVKIIDGPERHKLARVVGSVFGEPGTPEGGFVLCDLDSPDYCVDVVTNGSTSFFDNKGLGTDFSALSDGAMVVALGMYDTDPSVVLNAVVVEVGWRAKQVQGSVVSEPMDSKFPLLADEDDALLTVELQLGTKYFDVDGETSADAIVVGPGHEVEGTMPVDVDPQEDPDLMRAALVFIGAEEFDQVSGTIINDPDPDMRSFLLTSTEGIDTCVRVNDDADILFVDEVNSEITIAEFDNLAIDQSVDLFGLTAKDSCLEANEVIVEGAVAP